MRVRVADYIAGFLADKGICHCFTVVGGGAMHLNDALGHHEGITCIYNHHEQACAIAAEAHARLAGTIAAVCVTTGPGGTNALTGVVGGWIDSIPMLIISGQVRYDTTARGSGLPLRALGDQEFDICKAVESMTKYCAMVVDPADIRYCLERALYLATTGRPGPCWLDIPLNVQGGYVETDDLRPFDPADLAPEAPPIDGGAVNDILAKVRASQRPVFNAGAGIRISGGYDTFRTLVDMMGIPVVTGWDSIDLLDDAHPLYTGRGGIMGDRAGNFAIQNADLVLSIGSRLSIRQVGYNWKTWAREAYVIMEDVDRAELEKPTLHVDMPIWGDAKELMECMTGELVRQGISKDKPLFENLAWIETCQGWKKRYPVILPKHFEDGQAANVYAFMGVLGELLPAGQTIVVGNGSACVVGSHGMRIKEGTRFLINSGIASMGYDLPAAIGACVGRNGTSALYGAADDSSASIVLITGDGSIQMNLQELQTIIHHRMPIKIFVINNDGYHSIRQTQTNMFKANFCGIGPQSGDVSFPDMGKIATAYGYPYRACMSNAELEDTIAWALDGEGPAICEVFVDIEQNFEPKSATRKLPDGRLVSPPLEDLAPFLPREELKANLFVGSVAEE